jgi:hypothetical protein
MSKESAQLNHGLCQGIIYTNVISNAHSIILILHFSIKTRNEIHFGSSSNPLALDLVSHGLDGLAARSNEHNANLSLKIIDAM